MDSEIMGPLNQFDTDVGDLNFTALSIHLAARKTPELLALLSRKLAVFSEQDPVLSRLKLLEASPDAGERLNSTVTMSAARQTIQIEAAYYPIHYPRSSDSSKKAEGVCGRYDQSATWIENAIRIDPIFSRNDKAKSYSIFFYDRKLPNGMYKVGSVKSRLSPDQCVEAVTDWVKKHIKPNLGNADVEQQLRLIEGNPEAPRGLPYSVTGYLQDHGC